MPGDEVAIELPTGQRPAGTVEWVADGEAGIRFRQPIDMLALLNRKLVSQPGERRTMPRVELRCRVGIKWSGCLAAATLRNISARGLQVEGDGLPPRDTFVALFIDGLVVPAGEVVWRKGELAGIELMEELSWSSIMPWIRETGRKVRSLASQAHEAVEHALAAGVFEVDLELVAFDHRDRAVAELAVEHAHGRATRSSRPLLPRLTALARASMTRLRAGSRSCRRSRRAASRGRGCWRGWPGAAPRWAKGSACSLHCARHRLSPPVIVVSLSTWSSGSSATKRLGMQLVHWP